VGVAGAAVDRRDLHECPTGCHLEGDGVGRPLEQPDQGAGMAEDVLDGVERADPLGDVGSVTGPQQVLADVQGDSGVPGDHGGRCEEGDGFVEGVQRCESPRSANERSSAASAAPGLRPRRPPGADEATSAWTTAPDTRR